MEQRYFRSRAYRTIANRLIRTDPIFEDIKDSGFRIGFLSSTKEKKARGKIIYAECILVPEIYAWMIGYDFMIVVYEPNISHMNDKQIEILMKHELQHIGIDYSGEEPKRMLIPHDIEDFRNILEEYGIDWSAENVERAESE